MDYLLTILLSFYPAIYIYNTIPSAWMRWIDNLIPAGNGFFFAHLAAFSIIFFLSYVVLSKFVSLGYASRSHRSLMGVILMSVFTAGLGLIAFYNVLPGNMLYESPKFIDDYLLKNPFTFIALVAPFAYLYFD